jgi:signal transduction histidine kinase
MGGENRDNLCSMGLALRLILVLLIPVVLVVGVYGYVRSTQEQALLLDAQQRDLARTARAVRIAVENAVRDRQFADVERLLDEMVESQEAIDRIRIFDRAFTPVLVSNQLPIGDAVATDVLAQVMTSGRPQTVKETRNGRPVVAFVTTVRDRQGATMGVLEIVQIATGAEEQRRGANRDLVVRLAVLVVSITALVGIVLQRQVLRPLGQLVEGITRLGRGEAGPRLPVERRDELASVAEAFNEMAERLEAARRELVAESERAVDLERQLRQAATLAVAGKLASSIAHEIGTPLNIISARAEFLMRMAAPDSAERRDLESIVQQIDRITAIIKGLLDTLRAQKPDLRPTRLAAVVDRFVPLLVHSARRRGVSVVTSIPDDLPPLQADPAQLQQVIINLVLNAVEATPAGGRVEIGATGGSRKGRTEIAVRVRDTGTGIPADLLPRVFDAFFTTKPRGEGTGLGLAICRDIVRAHGGDIEVESPPGAGSTFTVWLPAAGDAGA